MKRCCTCAIEKCKSEFHKNSAKPDGLHNQCKTCRRLHYDTNGEKIRAYNKSWNHNNKDRIAFHNRNRKMSHRGRARQLWHGAKSRASKNNLPFDLTIDWIAEKLEVQRCERTGVVFDFDSGIRKTNPFAPSLDQIIPRAGYTTENTAVVCWAYNLGKHEMTHEQFVDFCRKIVEFNK